VGKNMALKDLWTIVLISTTKEAIMDRKVYLETCNQNHCQQQGNNNHSGGLLLRVIVGGLLLRVIVGGLLLRVIVGGLLLRVIETCNQNHCQQQGNNNHS
jgi:hypothetical protein